MIQPIHFYLLGAFIVAMFILINVALIGDINITYILGIDIVVWIVFHLILDVILHTRRAKLDI